MIVIILSSLFLDSFEESGLQVPGQVYQVLQNNFQQSIKKSMDKSMADILIFILNNDTQYFPFSRLQLVIETFRT